MLSCNHGHQDQAGCFAEPDLDPKCFAEPDLDPKCLKKLSVF